MDSVWMLLVNIYFIVNTLSLWTSVTGFSCSVRHGIIVHSMGRKLNKITKVLLAKPCKPTASQKVSKWWKSREVGPSLFFHLVVAYKTPDTEWIMSIHPQKANLHPSKVEAKLYRTHRPNGRHLQETWEQRRKVSPALPPGTIPFLGVPPLTTLATIQVAQYWGLTRFCSFQVLSPAPMTSTSYIGFPWLLL